MPRPRCCRRVAEMAGPRVFHPESRGGSADEVVLEAEEIEAIRLADHEGLYQEAAAAQMQVSRQTFGRIVTAARRKVATALLEGRTLRIAPAGPGVVAARWRRCGRCGHGWTAPTDATDAVDSACPECPACQSAPCSGARDPGRHCRHRRCEGTGPSGPVCCKEDNK